MLLTSRLKADYVELINKQLDHIPMESVDEFDLIKEALSNINNPIAGYWGSLQEGTKFPAAPIQLFTRLGCSQ